jgi:heme/copper-type cytochrome/quinol oxidase subunit 2
VAENTPVPLNRIERVLAFMIAGIGGLSLVAIIAILMASFSNADTSEGPWLLIAVFPTLGLPITLILIIILTVVAITRRRRVAREDGGD